MPYFASPVDGAQHYYRDYYPMVPLESSDNPALVMLHGWPMSSRQWEHLALPLSQDSGFRCILPDRRGFGKSDAVGVDAAARRQIIDYEVYVDDLEFLLKSLQLPNGFFIIGASMGSAEALHAVVKKDYVRKHCKGLIFVGSNLPAPLQSEANPTAPPRELWDSIRAGLRAERTGYVKSALPNVFGAHAGIEIAPGELARFEAIIDEADALAIDHCMSLILSTDFTEDLVVLSKSDPKIPCLLLHGDCDQSVPRSSGPDLVQSLVPHAELKMYEKAAHGLYLTHAQQIIADTLSFVKEHH